MGKAYEKNHLTDDILLLRRKIIVNLTESLTVPVPDAYIFFPYFNPTNKSKLILPSVLLDVQIN